VKSAIPLPSVKSGKLVTPTNEPVKLPVYPVMFNCDTVSPKATAVLPKVILLLLNAELGIPDKLASETLIPPAPTVIVESDA